MEKLTKYLIYIFVLVTSFSSLDASNKENPTTYIKLVPSTEVIPVKIPKGEIIHLPRFDKKISFDNLNLYGAIHNSFNSEYKLNSDSLIKERSILKEMEELSRQLGVNIRDRNKLDLFRAAADWLGTKYRRGSMSRKGVDCSGFTNIIYNTVFDKKIPRSSYDIANNLSEELSIDELGPGDLVFFSTLGKKRINHVGVYLGDGCFVHASISEGVKVSVLNEGYYQRTFKKAGRI